MFAVFHVVHPSGACCWWNPRTDPHCSDCVRKSSYIKVWSNCKLLGLWCPHRKLDSTIHWARSFRGQSSCIVGQSGPSSFPCTTFCVARSPLLHGVSARTPQSLGQGSGSRRRQVPNVQSRWAGCQWTVCGRQSRRYQWACQLWIDGSPEEGALGYLYAISRDEWPDLPS